MRTSFRPVGCAVAAAALLSTPTMALAASKAPPASVGTTINVGSSSISLGALTLGASQAQVKKLLGKPTSGSGTVQPEYNQYGIELLFSQGKLQTINITNPKITASGVGVGSTAAAVQSAISATNCSSAQYECYVTLPSNAQLAFHLQNGTVSMVQIDTV